MEVPHVRGYVSGRRPVLVRGGRDAAAAVPRLPARARVALAASTVMETILAVIGGAFLVWVLLGALVLLAAYRHRGP